MKDKILYIHFNLTYFEKYFIGFELLVSVSPIKLIMVLIYLIFIFPIYLTQYL